MTNLLMLLHIMITRHCDPEFSGEAICQFGTPINEITSSTPPRLLALSLNKSTGLIFNVQSRNDELINVTSYNDNPSLRSRVLGRSNLPIWNSN